MRVKGVIPEDFVNYKLPSMYISTAVCDFKCEKESGTQCCQNGRLAHAPAMMICDLNLIHRYLDNPITKAIVFGGLEPFDQFEELHEFLIQLREQYHCKDPVVIYTGYNKDELEEPVAQLIPLGNIVVKFGRYIPNRPSRYDPVLGVTLASDNQYAEQIC